MSPARKPIQRAAQRGAVTKAPAAKSTGPRVLVPGRVVLHPGDCVEVLRGLKDNSVDSVVTDPPYALTSIVKRFGQTSETDKTHTGDRARNRADGYARSSAGFMNCTWDTGQVAFDPKFWADVLRVMK